MSSRRIVFILLLLLALTAIGGAVAWQWMAADVDAAQPGRERANGIAADAPVVQVLTGDHPQVRAQRERERFEQDYRRFLREAADMPLHARRTTAAALAAQIDRREAARELSAGEGLQLRVALIGATEPDEAEQTRQVSAVAAEYRARAERLEAEHLAAQQADPHFRDYKAEEARIVAEVMAMRTIPDGLSREEYLRRRLQAAREAVWATPAPGR